MSFKEKLDKFFGISETRSTISTEIIAGIVTFLAMAYILTVNPNQIVGPGDPRWSSVFIATALGAIIGTLLMAFLAKLPLAQAPGMGLNSMVGGLVAGYGAFHCTYGNAMLMVFISGVLFLLLSILTIKGVSIRELIFDGIPECIRKAISVGIGLFIAYIGFQNCGLIVHNAFTQVGLIDFSSWVKQIVNVGSGAAVTPAAPIVCLFGVIVIAILEHFHVKGSVIIGILAATVLGIPLGITFWNSSVSWNVVENFKNFFSLDSEKGSFLIAFTEGFDWTLAFAEENRGSVMAIIMTIITFCMIDMFDTMGTVVGCCTPVGLVDENGKPVRYNKIMISDSVATCTGAVFGTSTVTTFVESGSGIAAGGRTGLTALVTAICFLISIFIMPVIASIPSAAAASALVFVGCLMVKGAVNLKVTNIKEAVASFFTIALMPLAYSITTGIGFGLLVYVIISVFCYVIEVIKYACSKDKENAVKPVWDVSVVCIIVSILFIVYFFVPTTI